MNAVPLLHLVTTNPLQLFAGLQVGPSRQLLSGFPTIDPNAGFVTQALGHLSAADWFGGHLPWWNPYEGIGAPLAGEMQSAAFLPFTVLLGFGSGFVVFHLLLEVVAGWGTYFLLRQLDAGRPAATCAGVAFALCGTFAWLSNSPANPIAFLPLALLGAEHCLQAAHNRRRGGWILLAIALALSVLAGFPEVAYLDGLLIALWCLVRLFSIPGGRARFIAKLGEGAAVAALISAPVLTAFLDYLPHANIGGHAVAFGNRSLDAHATALLVTPYMLGPISALHSRSGSDVFSLVWGNIGGYVSAVLCMCALVGLTGGRLRPLRIALGAWITLTLLKTFGVQPIARLVTHFPGLHATATYRYSPASWEMATIVLAALGVDDMAHRRVGPAVVLSAMTATFLLVGLAAFSAWPVLSSSTNPSQGHLYVLASCCWAVLSVAVVTVGAMMCRRARSPDVPDAQAERRARAGPMLMAGMVSLDAVLLFSTPLLSAPRVQPVDVAVVTFLQRHLGLHRFATLGPISPNYGSYFHVGEVNVNDLPIPATYSTYIEARLDTNTNPFVFTGSTSRVPSGPTPAQELSAHLSSYESLGVKYVVVSSSGGGSASAAWPPSNRVSGVRLVYSDATSRVYELPAPAPYLSASGGKCSIRAIGWDRARVRCARPVRLVRREQAMPGWSATVDGHDSTVRTVDGIFEEVDLPAGKSMVTFTFSPPFGQLASAACLAGIAILVGGAVVWLRDRRRSSVSTQMD